MSHAPYKVGHVFTTDADAAQVPEIPELAKEMLKESGKASRERSGILNAGWLQTLILVISTTASVVGIYWTLHNEVALNSLRIDHDHEAIVVLQTAREKDREDLNRVLESIRDKMEGINSKLNRVVGHFDRSEEIDGRP